MILILEIVSGILILCFTLVIAILTEDGFIRDINKIKIYFNKENNIYKIEVDIADSFSLDISKPLENVPTRFSNNNHNANSVLDLVFLYPSSLEFNCHHIHPNWRLSSDYAPITVKVSICKERISHTQQSLAKESDEENQFIENIIQIIKNVNMTIIQNAETLEEVVQSILSNIEES